MVDNKYYYTGSMVYNNDKTLSYALFKEGRVTKAGSSFTYEYKLCDHLGSPRVIVSESMNILEQNDYYPFGMRQSNAAMLGSDNRFRYNGKEEQNVGGLDLLDYGARFYDPQIGRWHSADPLADDYEEWSPYNYSTDDPINKLDPDGRWVCALVGAALDYGCQVYDNYKQSGEIGYDELVGNVNFVSVGLSAINPTGKFKVLKTIATEGAKALTENSTVNDGLKINKDIKEVVTKTAINSTVSIGTSKLTKASSNDAVKQADKKVVEANNKVSTAERRFAKSPNSSVKAKNLDNAKLESQQARNNQVKTKILNSTVGQVNENAVQQAGQTANDRLQKR